MNRVAGLWCITADGASALLASPRRGRLDRGGTRRQTASEALPLVRRWTVAEVVVDVNEVSFAEEVIEASRELPVVVDFWL